MLDYAITAISFRSRQPFHRLTLSFCLRAVSAAKCSSSNSMRSFKRYKLSRLSILLTYVPSPKQAGNIYGSFDAVFLLLKSSFLQLLNSRPWLNFYFLKYKLSNPKYIFNERKSTVGYLAQTKSLQPCQYINFENFFDTRQTRFDNIYTGATTSSVFKDIYTPLDGFNQ